MPVRLNLNVPSNAFSGEAVRLDPSPYTNLFMQNQYRAQAKQDAMAQFYENYAKNLTPKGMKGNDVDDLMAKKNMWQSYVTQNLRTLSNPNHPAYAKTEQTQNQLYNDALATTEKSLASNERINTFKSLMNNPARASRMTEGAMDAFHAESLPVNDPNHKELDFTSPMFSEAPWTVNDEQKLQRTLGTNSKMNYTALPVKQDPKTGTEVHSWQSSFDPQSLSAIQNTAQSLYHNDARFKEKVDNDNQYHDAAYEARNDLFKKNYGHDIQNGYDAATAYALSVHPSQPKADVVAKMNISPQAQSDLIEGRQKRLQTSAFNNRQSASAISDASWEAGVNDAKNKVNALKNTSWGAGTTPEGISVPINIDQAGLKGMSPNAKEPYDHAVLHGDGTIGLIKGGQSDEHGNIVGGQEYEKIPETVAKTRYLNTYKAGTIKTNTSQSSSGNAKLKKGAFDNL